MPWIHAAWVILGDDVRTASRRLIFFIEILQQALYIPIIWLYYIQMWKQIVVKFYVTYFLEHVECSSHWAVTSYHNQQEEIANCWWPMLRKNKTKQSFMVIKSIAIRLCTSKQVGLRVNTIIGDVMGWQNSKSIELSSSDDLTQVADLGDQCPVSVTLTYACTIPNVVKPDCKQRGAVVIHRKYQSSEVK